jgi:MYXO-CTERM domain-containing protein
MRGGTRPLSFAATLLVAASGSANVELSAFVRALPGDLDASDALRRAFGDSVSVIVTAPDGVSLPVGAVRIAPGLGVLDLSVERFTALSSERRELRFEWSAPLRLLLDRADGWVGSSRFRNETGFTGRGTIIGVIDSGADLSHPDLRTEDGKTRVRYWLDFARQPAGFQPELEANLGCDGDVPCAVFGSDDIDALLANGDSGDDPRDTFGHGTHVASLAAGNGLSTGAPSFVGVAPEATLIVVRATRSNGAILDGDVLKAARFVFDRADELGMPAVVNLSLGSDFGGHDGSSALERGLAAMVGPEHPGHAVVVAAGNSAGMYADLTEDLPGPFGIHTEVHVPDGAESLVPILTLGEGSSEVQGVVYVWIATRPGDALSVGVEDPDGTVLDPVAPGGADQMDSDDVQITVINQTSAAPSPIPEGSSGAVVMLNGSWPAERLFGITLEGPGSAQIWVQGGGGLSPELSLGPLLPRAQKEGTINVPATSPSVISVGATLNRSTWSDHTGETVTFPEHGSLDDAPDDTVAFFSSAGPNALGLLKPDIVAPGANVIGAMSRYADPRDEKSNGIFAGLGRCTGFDDECFVVDDGHAVSSGTSMAAPIVAGAVALLFERDPALDQEGVRALLAAGARKLEGVVLLEQQTGAGALDLEGSLEALADGALERVPGSESRLVLASSFAHPDPAWPLEGLLELRDDEGRVADGFDLERLTIEPDLAAFELAPTRLAPGLVRFLLRLPAGAGGKTLRLRVTFDGETLLARDVPVAVDHALSEEAPVARGGCNVAPGSGRTAPSVAFALLGVVALVRASRRRRVARC